MNGEMGDKQSRAGASMWSIALGVNVALVVVSLLVMLLRAAPPAVSGPSEFGTLTVENASNERVLVTPLSDTPSRWSGHIPGRGERGMLLIESGAKRPGTRVGRFEVAPGATWTVRFDREGRWLAGVVVEGKDGVARVIPPPATEKRWEELKVRIAEVGVGAIAPATAQEARWYAGIPADLGFDVLGAVLWLPLLNLPWVVWMRARARERVAASPA